MKLDTLIDFHQRKCKVQAKMPEHPSVGPFVLTIEFLFTYTLDAHLIFFRNFTFFVEKTY